MLDTFTTTTITTKIDSLTKLTMMDVENDHAMEKRMEKKDQMIVFNKISSTT